MPNRWWIEVPTYGFGCHTTVLERAARISDSQ